MQVMHSSKYAEILAPERLPRDKGSDASWQHDEEPPSQFLEYSDDEEEALAKRPNHGPKKSSSGGRKRGKRGKRGGPAASPMHNAEGGQQQQHSVPPFYQPVRNAFAGVAPAVAASATEVYTPLQRPTDYTSMIKAMAAGVPVSAGMGMGGMRQHQQEVASMSNAGQGGGLFQFQRTSHLPAPTHLAHPPLQQPTARGPSSFGPVGGTTLPITAAGPPRPGNTPPQPSTAFPVQGQGEGPSHHHGAGTGY